MCNLHLAGLKTITICALRGVKRNVCKVLLSVFNFLVKLMEPEEGFGYVCSVFTLWIGVSGYVAYLKKFRRKRVLFFKIELTLRYQIDRKV